MRSKRIIIVTPFYYGRAGGAGVYYQRLASLLLDNGYAVTIISEKSSSADADEMGRSKFEYLGLFPERCALDRKYIRDALRYLVQNLQYHKIWPAIFNRPDTQAVLIHTSFLNRSGFFHLALRRISSNKLDSLRLIGDCRDRQLPKKFIRNLDYFDEIIACSHNVSMYLSENGVDPRKLRYIPVVQEKVTFDARNGEVILSRHRVTGSPVILYAGLIKPSKGVMKLVDAFESVVRTHYPRANLVLAGLWKSSKYAARDFRETKTGVRYIGALRRRDLLDLMSVVDLIVNPSMDEGMPRSSLEALASGARVLLPGCVPEFRECGAKWILDDHNVPTIGRKMVDALRYKDRPEYQIDRHLPEQVIDSYIQALGIGW